MARGCKRPYTRRDLYKYRHLHQTRVTYHIHSYEEENQSKTTDNGIRAQVLCHQCKNSIIDDDLPRNSSCDTRDTTDGADCTHNKTKPPDAKDPLLPFLGFPNQSEVTKPTSISSHKDHDLDVVDYVPHTDTFSLIDFIIYLFSIFTYLADVGTDIWVAYMYFNQGHTALFIFTLLFILIPAITMTSFSLAWYVQDHRHNQTVGNASNNVSKVHWASRTICLILQIGPVIRYVECLLYGVRSKKDRHWYNMLVFEDTDSTLLRLLECFMEATPQLVLQLYIMITLGLSDGWLMVVIQILSCVTSLASVCWALVSYHRALRYSLQNKANMTYGGMALQFFWRVFTIGARVIALAMFAAVYTYWAFVAVACHWIIMFIWILAQRTHFCDGKYKEFFFNVVMAIVYVFCYVNLHEGHTRLRYVFFYSLMYAENIALIIAWYAITGTSGSWYVVPVMVTVFTCPSIGIAFMLIYYRCCHPNNLSAEFSSKRIKVCVHWKDLYLCQQPPDGANGVVSDALSHELQSVNRTSSSQV